jgi:hypothetical protein
MYMDSKSPPELSVAQWFNTENPITLDGLRGRVIVLHTFQMLCPGCVAQGIPQAKKVHNLFSSNDVIVLGLHTVFEHHNVMGPDALRAFLYEYKITFPVGVDLPSENSPVPTTMQAYGLRGTPSLIVIDRSGRVRLNHFGHIDDLQLGALLGTLLSEPAFPDIKSTAMDQSRVVPASDSANHCGEGQCYVSNPGPSQ